MMPMAAISVAVKSRKIRNLRTMKRRIFLFSVALLLFGASGLLLLEQRASRQAAESAGQAPISVKKAQARPQPRLSAELTRISDTGIHWEERIAAVRELPTHLGQSSLDFLFAYLSAPFDEHEENRYLVCNEIMEILRKRSLAPELYTEKLNALIANPKADPVMRDYAAQHLAQWISGISPEATEPDPARIPAALATMGSVPILSQIQFWSVIPIWLGFGSLFSLLVCSMPRLRKVVHKVPRREWV